jgi:hypothetical protein
LWQTARKFLKDRLWVVRDPVFYEEMQTFQKESPEDRGASAEESFNDDVVMAGIIALYTAHELDWDENFGMMPACMPGPNSGMKRWTVYCMRCDRDWQSDNPNAEVCTDQECVIAGGMQPCKRVRATMNVEETISQVMDFERELTYGGTVGNEKECQYDAL